MKIPRRKRRRRNGLFNKLSCLKKNFSFYVQFGAFSGGVNIYFVGGTLDNIITLFAIKLFYIILFFILY